MSQKKDAENRVYENSPNSSLENAHHSRFDFLKKISVEPSIALNALGYSLVGVQVATLYIQKTCRVGSYFFGNQTFSADVCNNLFNGSFDEEQKIVQSVTAKVEIVTQILQTIPMVIFALFLGPWSDSAGRKMLILLPLIGKSVSVLTYLVNIYFFDELVVEFLWLETFSSYFGGWTLIYVGAYGYIADTTSEKSRTLRIVVMDGVGSVAETIGGVLNGYLFAALGFYGSFGASLACYILAVTVTFFLVQNRKAALEAEKKPRILSFRNVLDAFKVLFKPRPGSLRHIIIILVICFQLNMFAGMGAWTIDYLYVRRKFDWNDEGTIVTFFSQLNAFKSGVNLFGFFIILPIFVKVFKLHDITIATLAVVSGTIKYLIYCFSNNKNMLYAILGAGLMDTLFTQPVRSSLSKLAGTADIGKVFAAVGALQALMGFASPVFNIIYVHTLDSFIGTVYLVTTGICVIIIALLIYCYFFLNSEEAKAKDDNDQEVDSQEKTQL